MDSNSTPVRAGGASSEAPGIPSPQRSGASPTEQHIRGSSLLLAGRMLALGLNLATQVVAVRFFSKSDYGALAYGLSVATLGATVSSLGLDKAASRFIPIYREHGHFTRMFGALVLMFSTVGLLGAAVVSVVLGLHGVVSHTSDPTAAALLVILIVLAPVGAIDNLFVSLFTVFSGARAIFLRKHLLGPLLKLSATLLVVAAHGRIQALAWGMVAAGILGTTIYGVTLLRLLRQQDVLHWWRHWRQDVPARQILSFSFPIFGSDMVFFLRSTFVVLMLQHFKDASTVASYQAVVPAARLNMVVRESFAYLFVPMAARLLARNDRRGIEDLYCHTTIWVVMLSFPIFVITFALASPLTLLLFGERYADSGRILAILALGQFFNAAVGLGVLTLRVLGKIRTIVMIDIIITTLSLTLNFLLIPRFGAFGAAVATGSTLLVHGVLNLVGLYRASGISLAHRRYLRFFTSILAGTGVLVLVQTLLSPPIWLGLPLALAVIATVVGTNRHLLEVAATFPQLLRFGPLRWLFGSGRPR